MLMDRPLLYVKSWKARVIYFISVYNDKLLTRKMIMSEVELNVL